MFADAPYAAAGFAFTPGSATQVASAYKHDALVVHVWFGVEHTHTQQQQAHISVHSFGLNST